MSAMVTRIGQRRRAHLYIREWMKDRELSVPKLAGRIGVERQTVYRWVKEPHRLDIPKLEIIAKALDLGDFRELFQPPARPSLDALTAGIPDEIHGDILEFARRLVKRAS